MTRLDQSSVKGLGRVALGPGTVVINCLDPTPTGIAEVLAGDESKGIKLGMATSAPTVTLAPEWQNLMDGIVGANAQLKGSKQLQGETVTIAMNLIEVDYKHVKYIYPSFDTTNWTSDRPGTLAVGTANSRFSVSSRLLGTAGNTPTIAVTVPAAASVIGPVVTVSGSAISVATATAGAGVSSSTAQDVVDAINASSAAKALVRAGLSGTSDGTGIVAAVTAAPLAGGIAGTKIGTVQKSRGSVADSDYIDNMYMVLESKDAQVFKLYRLLNLIATENYEINPPDDNNKLSISQTWMAHSTDVDKDPVTGVTIAPYAEFTLSSPTIV